MNDPDFQRLDDALDTLAEHFDTLIIFATRYETEAESGAQGTVAVVRRLGNYYGSLGLIREWIARQDESGRIKEKDIQEGS